MPNASNRKNLTWSRLDNAAKIFPPTARGTATGVFRLSCELNEQVDPDLLQQALDLTLPGFPHLLMVMRRGLFWHYLEQTPQQPLVVPEHTPPCAPLYENSASLLFEVSYWQHKINLSMFHVLADGSGAITFFTALVTRYLLLCHPGVIEQPPPHAPISRREADSFQKYYTPVHSRPVKITRAYRLRGPHKEDHTLRILEGVADVNTVLEAAHRYNTTLTVYLAAVMMSAIYKEMYIRHAKRPIVLTVPVDLRSYFPSDTTRNFFGTIRVSYNFRERNGDFPDIIETIMGCFRSELVPQKLATRMNAMAALEHNPLIRPIPLPLKNLILRISGGIADLGETAVFSNIGKFKLPEEFAPFIRGFGVFMSTDRLQLCTCSYGNSLHFGFTSSLASTDVQRHFFQMLTAQGIAVEIRSNEYYQEE